MVHGAAFIGLLRIEDPVFIGCVVAEGARSENTTFLGPLPYCSSLNFVSNPGLMLSMRVSEVSWELGRKVPLPKTDKSV